MNDQQFVSVIIPAFNAAAHLGEALHSVLAQSVRPSQVIVVDDGSSDDTSAVGHAFGAPVEVLRIEHGGIGAARNAGLAVATGDFIALLDADDLWEPRKLELQLGALERDPGLAGIFCGVTQFVSSELSEAERTKLTVDAASMPGFLPSALLLRRDAYERVGPFATGLRVGEFIDWHARAIDAGLRFAMLDEVLVRRRIHGANTGRIERDSRVDYLRVLKNSLDRRRAAASHE